MTLLIHPRTSTSPTPNYAEHRGLEHAQDSAEAVMKQLGLRCVCLLLLGAVSTCAGEYERLFW